MGILSISVLNSSTCITEVIHDLKLHAEQFYNFVICNLQLCASDPGDFEGHLGHASYWDPVTTRAEQQEFLLHVVWHIPQHLPETPTMAQTFCYTHVYSIIL